MEGREPGEDITHGHSPDLAKTGRPLGSLDGGRKRGRPRGPRSAQPVASPRVAYVVCCRCGGSSADGSAMLHKRCLDMDDVPF